MRVEHDAPNYVYVHMGDWMRYLAQMGATDKELRRMFKKGGDASLTDIAAIECAHTRIVKGDA